MESNEDNYDSSCSDSSNISSASSEQDIGGGDSPGDVNFLLNKINEESILRESDHIDFANNPQNFSEIQHS